MKPLLMLFGATDNILPYAETYLSIVVIGTLTHLISFGANSFIRGEGNPRVAMGTMLIGGILNVILDYLFIVVFKWGIAGAAWATVTGYSVSSLWVLHYFLKGQSLLKLRRKHFRVNLESTKNVLLMGSPHFIMNFISSIQMSIFNNQLARLGGDNAIAINGVIMSFNMIWIMPVIGISQGLQPIVGYNYGAKQFARVRKALLMAIFTATSFCTVFFIAIELFPSYVFMMFTSNNASELVTSGAPAIRRFLLFLPVVGYLILSGNYYQFTGRPKISLALTIIRQVVFLIPALMVLPEFLGLNGVWYAMPASDAGAMLLTTFFFIRELRLLKQKISDPLKPDTDNNIDADQQN